MLSRRSVIAAALGGAGCSKRPVSKPRVRVLTGLQRSSCGLYLAQEMGLFETAGLNVEIERYNQGTQWLPLLVGGTMDVVFAQISASVINAFAKGAALQVVAGREYAAPGCGDFGSIFGLRKAFPKGMEDLSQLKGKRISVGPTPSFGEFCLDLHLARAGLTQKDVQVVKLLHNQSVAALVGGSLDAAVMHHDLDTSLERMGDAIVKGPNLANHLPYFQHSFVFFRSRELGGDPSLGARFLSVYLRGARLFLEGKTPQVMDEFIRSSGYGQKRFAAACRHMFPADGAINRESLKYYSGWAVKKGYCPELVNVDRLVDEDHLKKAHRMAM